MSLLEKAKAVQVSRMQVAADSELEREVNRNGGFVLCWEGTVDSAAPQWAAKVGHRRLLVWGNQLVGSESS